MSLLEEGGREADGVEAMLIPVMGTLIDISTCDCEQTQLSLSLCLNNDLEPKDYSRNPNPRLERKRVCVPER